jgi:transcriptional regulator with XRE-family HTH domain
MDKMPVILSRIEPLMVERDLSAMALSLEATQGRSKDLIRNWQRAVAKGEEVSARLDSIAAVAQALGVSDVWLATGRGAEEAITDEERALLAAYRAIPEERRPKHLQAAVQLLQLGTPEETEEADDAA